MKINCLQHVLREGDSHNGFYQQDGCKQDGSTKGHTDEQRARLKKTIREKETYYNILADRIRMHSIF